MGISYTRILKPKYANDFNEVISLGNKVRHILSGITHEDPDADEYINEVKIQMQPRVDGGLALIGWIGREPISGMPEEEFNPEKEIVPEIEAREISEEVVTQRSPFESR